MAATTASSTGWLERKFKLRELGTSISTEIMAGLTTFMVMAYIIFVNSDVLTLNGAGPLTAPQVATVTCLVAGVMSIAMGLYSNRAIAIAPGLGLNAIVAFTLVGAMGLSFPEAMGVVVTEGLVITLLVVTGIRRYILEMIPLVLKKAISVGIGAFVLLLGLRSAGLIVFFGGAEPVGSSVGRLDLARLQTWPIFVALVGFLVMIILLARGVKAAIFFGILAATITAYIVPGDVASFPSNPFSGPDFSLVGKFSFGYVSKLGILTSILVVISLMLSDFFDTMGTLIGVGAQAGYLTEDGELPEAEKPLLIDSIAAMVGGMVSSSSATSYIESTAGVAAGGRSGLVVVVSGLCFLIVMPFVGLVGAIPAAATAPALIVVGLMMMSSLADDEQGHHVIDWTDMEQSFPIGLTMLMMPMTMNITYGIGVGFISYVVIKLARGKVRDLNPALLTVAVLFLAYFMRFVLFDANF